MFIQILWLLSYSPYILYNIDFIYSMERTMIWNHFYWKFHGARHIHQRGLPLTWTHFITSTCKWNHVVHWLFLQSVAFIKGEWLEYSVQEVKDKVLQHLEAEANQWLGSAMTYTLFQYVQEHYTELISAQPDSIVDLNLQTNQLKITDENQQVRISYIKL